MAVFPQEIAPTGFDYDIVRSLDKSEYRGGYQIQKHQTTRPYRIFKLSYNNLTLDQKNTLEQFYLDNTGTTFDFIEPQTDISYTVKYTEDKANFKLKPSMNSYTYSVMLREE